ncbi:hypothetical protein COO91_10788 (plasmid) [Nostoc flagelliforme CCNUN1]|uniref:Uncharacterized protein n=1 Tax=Nostoc flagelliforme CCNUN1 TaxID=2038116 RepID=A0A2K8TA62_9NOSO|nr:hypothetical protein [Nostoc flagelliforme]AUB44552.1 hypothetical protein COO91_10788 [Nostoc flagelliforme CCNUN1]
MQPTITLPRGYGIPKFYVGQRTQQGKIIGIEVLPHDSFLTENCGSGYRYLVMVSRYTKEVKYLESDQITQLSPSEVEAEILEEVDWHLTQLVLLQSELKADLKIQTPFGQVNPPISTTKRTNGSGSRLSKPKKEKVAA